MLDFEIREMLENNEIGDLTYFRIDSLFYRYSINKKGIVYDSKLNRPMHPSLINGKYYYTLRIDDKNVVLPLNKLYLMAFSPMHTTIGDYIHKLNVLVFDKSIRKPDINNMIWEIPKGGIECFNHPGFYSIVGNPLIVISKDYQFINYETGKEYKITYPSNNNTHYPSIAIVDRDKVKYPFQTRDVHRLVGLAFIPLYDQKRLLVINHKDGIKNNFNVENLEWVTYRENNIHAFATDLRNDNVVTIAVNIETKEKKRFYSFQEGARILGIHAWDISKSKVALKEKGMVITSPWIFLDDGETIPTSFNGIRQTGFVFFQITNTESKEVQYLRGIRNLSKFLGTKHFETIDVMPEETTYSKYHIKKLFKNDLPVSVKEELLANWSERGGKIQKNIRVTDTSNNSVVTYNSTDEFATLVGAKRKTIQHSVALRDGVWRNFKIEYL